MEVLILNNHTPGKVWNGITYPYLNFNSCAIETFEKG